MVKTDLTQANRLEVKKVVKRKVISRAVEMGVRMRAGTKGMTPLKFLVAAIMVKWIQQLSHRIVNRLEVKKVVRRAVSSRGVKMGVSKRVFLNGMTPLKFLVAAIMVKWVQQLGHRIVKRDLTQVNRLEVKKVATRAVSNRAVKMGVSMRVGKNGMTPLKFLVAAIMVKWI